MLRIKDESFEVINNVDEENYKGQKSLIITGTYSPMPSDYKNWDSSVVDPQGEVIVIKKWEKKNHCPLCVFSKVLIRLFHHI